MPRKPSNPTFKKVKRDIEALIHAKSDVLEVGRSTLVYRIRDHFGWPGSTNAIIHKVLSNKVYSGHLVLLDRNGRPLTVSHQALKQAAGCEILEPLPNLRIEPAKPGPEPPKPLAAAAVEPPPVVAEVRLAIPPVPMPEPVLPLKAPPTWQEVLDMAVLELWLTPAAEIRHETNVLPVIARQLGVAADNTLKRAIREGCQAGRLDIWPRHGSIKVVMVQQVPSAKAVEALRAQYPHIAAGRRWPPLPAL